MQIKLASDVAPFLEEKLMNVPLSAVFGDSENRKRMYGWWKVIKSVAAK